MRRKATDALGLGARHETIDASEARRETRDIRRVSSLSSCNLVSRLTSHAPTPWPKVKLGKEGGARHETIDASIASSLASKTARVSRLTSHAPWPTVLLGEVTIMKRGKYITRNDTSPGDVPVILGGQEPAYYCDKANHTGPCVVISRSGASAGFVSYWAQPIFVTDGFLFEANEQSNIRYVYYCLKANQSLLGNMQNGTGIPHVRGDDLKSFQIPLPPLPIQRRIADVLSAYDDLIENNRRRIAILEETARLAYRKWFGGSGAKGGMRHETIDASEVRRETRDVRRVSSLPSHASVSRLTSHAQLRTVTLGEICQTFGGGTPKTTSPEFWDGDIPWVVPTDITRNTCLALLDTERKITALGLQKSSAKMLPANAILMTSRASVGYFGMADFPVCTNQGFISIVPNNDSWRWYLLFNLMSRVEEIRSNAKGSTFPEISRARFRSMDVAIPDDNALIEFNRVVEPLMQQVRILAKQSAALAAARDMLLPRLMKGGTT